ncbi:hypothetical protein KUTeg_010028 [Tegillarca granosa]|uniref:Glycosyl transferase family 1 domain-containing protein n=1 Tax=Tegillarca granosa TaxID=220873 RepID=A0ABQ9F8M9_TEGGR|nr:hypothetical protein KUTeg_010028 [Tegillarca granosa]
MLILLYNCRRYIEENDQYTCLIKDPADINECIINQLILQHNVTVVLAIHAYRSGRLLTNCSVPIILILGGTDINEFSKYEDKLQIMNQVVFKSKFIVAFSSAMVEKAKALWNGTRTRKDVFLVIIGPETDAEYQKYFLDSISGLSGVYYIPGLSLCDAHAAIKESFAVVNTSESEGMAAVILEAMQMGVPVLARDNYGNKSLIQDGVTGFIFDSPKVCH